MADCVASPFQKKSGFPSLKIVYCWPQGSRDRLSLKTGKNKRFFHLKEEGTGKVPTLGWGLTGKAAVSSLHFDILERQKKREIHCETDRRVFSQLLSLLKRGEKRTKTWKQAKRKRYPSVWLPTFSAPYTKKPFGKNMEKREQHSISHEKRGREIPNLFPPKTNSRRYQSCWPNN